MIKTCEACQQEYISKSVWRKKCPDCCKCQFCGAQFSDSSKRFCNHSCAAQWSVQNSDHLLKNLESARASENYGPQRIVKIVQKVKGVPRPSIRGANHPSYKGTRTERRTAMEQTEYKLWRATVFKRDNYTCVLCYQHFDRMEAHHIYPWATYSELRYEVSNGVTLCSDCHDAIRGNHADFAERFAQYVRTAAPVFLTPQESERFLPFFIACSYCGKELRRKPCFRSKRWHFCDNRCRRAYEVSINFEWSKHRNTASESH